MKRKLLQSNLTIFSLLLFCMTCFHTFGQTKKISMQGFLKDANGKAIDDGNQSLNFKIYTVASGGTAIWSEVQSIKVFGGVYSAQLGSITDISALAWDVPYFVGVTVQGTELSPRTELTYAPYSFGTNKAQEVVCSGAVGDVKYSVLNPTQFAAANGSCWVAMDGRNIAGSKLATITGMTTVTNAGGLFLRGQEFSNSGDYDPDRNSGSPISQVQSEAFAGHSHSFSGSTSNNNTTPYNSLTYFYDIWTGDGAFRPGGTRTESFEDGRGNPDRFLFTNTIDISGNHAHSFSGNTNTTGSNETRPDNLNLWTYIRIN